MTPRPDVHPVTERLYEALGAQTRGDERSWTLLLFAQALTQPLALASDLGADSDAGPGWSGIFDLDRCPPAALGFLAQFVGSTTAPGLPDAEQRARIADAEGWRRGTPAAIIAAAKTWLTGEKHVVLTERAGGNAYRLAVQVYEAEAYDVDQLEAAIRAAVPAGILITLEVVPGWTYAQLNTHYAGQTYTALNAEWAGQTYSDFRRFMP